MAEIQEGEEFEVLPVAGQPGGRSEDGVWKRLRSTIWAVLLFLTFYLVALGVGRLVELLNSLHWLVGDTPDGKPGPEPWLKDTARWVEQLLVAADVLYLVNYLVREAALTGINTWKDIRREATA